MREDPLHLAQEATLRERRSWIYVSLATVMILLVTFGFIWLTW
jgi:hypothetical protein